MTNSPVGRQEGSIFQPRHSLGSWGIAGSMVLLGLLALAMRLHGAFFASPTGFVPKPIPKDTLVEQPSTRESTQPKGCTLPEWDASSSREPRSGLALYVDNVTPVASARLTASVLLRLDQSLNLLRSQVCFDLKVTPPEVVLRSSGIKIENSALGLYRISFDLLPSASVTTPAVVGVIEVGVIEFETGKTRSVTLTQAGRSVFKGVLVTEERFTRSLPFLETTLTCVEKTK